MARIRSREPFGQIKILGGTRCRSHQTPGHIRHRFGAAVAASMLLSLTSRCWVNGPGCVRTNAMARTISSANSICVPRFLFGTPGPWCRGGVGLLQPVFGCLPHCGVGPVLLTAPEPTRKHGDRETHENQVNHGDQSLMAARTSSAVVANFSASSTVFASTMSNLAPLRSSSKLRR